MKCELQYERCVGFKRMEIFKDYLQSLVANLLFEKDVKSVRLDSKLFGKTNRDIGLPRKKTFSFPGKYQIGFIDSYSFPVYVCSSDVA